MLPSYYLRPAPVASPLLPEVSAERFLLPQPAVLTTVEPQSGQGAGLSLPNPVYVAVVECRASALRAWRNYCGLSMRSLRHRTETRMSTATLEAFDSGTALFCEWTVGVLAEALHVECWQLLRAQMIAVEHQDRPEPCSGKERRLQSPHE